MTPYTFQLLKTQVTNLIRPTQQPTKEYGLLVSMWGDRYALYYLQMLTYYYLFWVNQVFFSSLYKH